MARPGPPTSGGEPGPTIRNIVKVAFLLRVFQLAAEVWNCVFRTEVIHDLH